MPTDTPHFNVRQFWAVAASVLFLASYGFLMQRAISGPKEIQTSRKALCEAANRRHDKVLGQLALDFRLGREHGTPAQKEQTKASEMPTILLVEDLAPHEDCSKR